MTDSIRLNIWNISLDVKQEIDESEGAAVEEDSCEGPVSSDRQIWNFSRVSL